MNKELKEMIKDKIIKYEMDLDQTIEFIFNLSEELKKELEKEKWTTNTKTT